MKKAKNINPIKLDTKKSRLAYMVNEANNFDPIMQPVYIARGNKKTGDLVPSVSLRPVLDCGNCSACAGLCYDLRNDCVYKGVRDTRAHNYKIWSTDPDRYFEEISFFCHTQVAFRWHIGGDIKNMDYLKGMIRVARENQHCKFLVFTKMFDLVNTYLDSYDKPENLSIVFSAWVGQDMPNPHNLPTSNPLFADGQTTAHDGAIWCGGNCSQCLINKCGCFDLKPGQEVIFPAH